MRHVAIYRKLRQMSSISLLEIIMKNNIFYLLLVLFISLGIAGHAKSAIGVKSTDPEYIQNLKALLTKKGVPYTIEGEFIRWNKEYEAKAEEARKLLAKFSGVLYTDIKVRNYFKTLLTKNNKIFIESKKKDGIWVLWWPENDSERDKYGLEVAKFKFQLMADENN